METSPEYILANSYNADASYLTSYAVIPKFETIVATQAAWRALTAAQQAAIRQAAADTLAHARQVPARESQELAGLLPGRPHPRRAVARPARRPGARNSRRVPAGARVAAMVRMIRADVPGTGPQPSAIALPPRAAPRARRRRRSRCTTSACPAAPGNQGATIPPGTYVTTDTVADLQAGGQYGADWNTGDHLHLAPVPRRDGLLRPSSPASRPALRPGPLHRERRRGHVHLGRRTRADP